MSKRWGQLSALLAKSSIEKRIPLIGEFELTARCNLRCKMCYVSLNENNAEVKGRERSAKEWIKLATEARDAGTLFLLLTGGEVFVRNDFKTIYEEINQMGFHVSIYTNGTMITPGLASWLGKLPPSQMDITLYGASPETYYRVCGDESGFVRALNGVKLLLDQGINVQIRITLVRDNVNDFKRLDEIAKNFNLPLGIVNYISPRRDGNGHIAEDVRLSPQELAEFEHKTSLGDFIESPNPLEDKASEATGMFINPEMYGNNLFNQCDSFPCSNGKNAFWITWDGRMVPCSLMDQPSTDPFEEGFQMAWKRLLKLCDKVPDCKICKSCDLYDYCSTCPAKLINESGSYKTPSSYLCELARERYRLSIEDQFNVGIGG